MSSLGSGASVLSDQDVAMWLEQCQFSCEGTSEMLDVLRDEVTAAQEVAAWAEALEHSGSWAPECAEVNKSEHELLEEYWKSLVEEHGTEAEKEAEMAALRRVMKGRRTSCAAPPLVSRMQSASFRALRSLLPPLGQLKSLNEGIAPQRRKKRSKRTLSRCLRRTSLPKKRKK